MDGRKRGRLNRIDRWLREIGEPERRAPPIDFADITGLSQHACPGGKCPLRWPAEAPMETHAAVPAPRAGGGVGHATIAPQVSAHDPPVRVVKQVTSDSLPTTESSSSSGSMEFTSTESNTELKQSSESSLASSLDSNKMKVVRREQHQHQRQHQQRSRQSCHGGSGDNRVEASGAQAPAAPVQPLPNMPSAQQLQLPLPPPQQQQRPLPMKSSSSKSKEPPPPQPLPPSQLPAAASSSSSVLAAAVAGTSGAGVTYYFHLSKQTSPTSRDQRESVREQQLLALMRSLRDSDPELCQISAARGVAITLGRSVEPPSVVAAYRRKVVIQGANWRNVMDAVNDISRAFPDLMSPGQSSVPHPVSGGTATSAFGEPQQVLKPQPQQPQLMQQPRPLDRSAASPKQGSKPSEQTRVHSQLQHSSGQHQQHQPRHSSAHQQVVQLHPSAANSYATGSNNVGGAGLQQFQPHHQHQHQPHQSKHQQPAPPPQPTPSAPPPSASGQPNQGTSKSKLAQNVRFQLTTQQRESLFTQDEAGRPTHPRLKHLLSALGMDMIFLERSFNHENVPSVKVRFFFERFDQLTAFCKEIDYQIPTQS